MKAENELEKSIVSAQQGIISAEQFLRELLDREVFMPIYEKQQIGGFQSSQTAVPLTIEDDEGQTLVVLFTSPERAKNFTCQYPGYEGGLLTEFKWVMGKIGGGMGVIINPDLDIGLELAADMLDQMSRLH